MVTNSNAQLKVAEPPTGDALPKLDMSWLNPGEISVRSGNAKVVLAVDYSRPGVDDQALAVGCLTAEKLDTHALVNCSPLYPQFAEAAADENNTNADGAGEGDSEENFGELATQLARSVCDAEGEPVAVVFLRGIDPGKADDIEPSLRWIIGKGYVGEYVPEMATGSEAFLSDLIDELREHGLLRDDITECSGEGGLAYTMRQELGQAVEAAEITIPRPDADESQDDYHEIVEQLADALEAVEYYLAEDGASQTNPAESDHQVIDAEDGVSQNGDSKQDQAANEDRETTPGVVSVDIIPEKKYLEKIAELEKRETIVDDKGQEIAFNGETRDTYVECCKQGMQVARITVAAMYECGRRLDEIHQKMKPLKLWGVWLKEVGINRSHARNYLLIYRRYGDKLADFAHLGVKKLLIASKVKDPVQYVEDHQAEIEEESAEQLDEKVKKLRAKPSSNKKANKETQADQKLTPITIGGCVITPSKDGKTLVVNNLSKKKHDALIEVVKDWLSNNK